MLERIAHMMLVTTKGRRPLVNTKALPNGLLVTTGPTGPVLVTTNFAN